MRRASVVVMLTGYTTLTGYTEHDIARRVVEPIKESVRSPFARDRARVLHSSALRRLAAKTQVQVAGIDDFPRTRLTHTLEVGQIARELGDSLGCDPDLVEVAGFTHDLGHPPFGHNGEDELDRICADIGGFEGNAQTLRVLTRLESKVFDPDSGQVAGLNLTRAALDASCKYPWARRPGERKYGYYADDADIFHWLREEAPGERTCLEEQVMDWSDDVAYSVHDAEDAIQGGLVTYAQLRDRKEQAELVRIAKVRYLPDVSTDDLQAAIERIAGLEYLPQAFDGTMRDLAALKRFTSYLIGRFSVAAQVATQLEYGDEPLTRYAADLVVPPEVRAEVAVMKAVAVAYVMHRPGADAVYEQQRAVLAEVVDALVQAQGRHLEPWMREAYDRAQTDAERLRVVVDQVASLTDVSVVALLQRLSGRQAARG